MKTVLAVIIIILIVGGLLYWYSMTNPESGGSPLTKENTNELPSGTDASDDGLEEDFAAIETQMDTFISDTAQIDAGLNDKPVEQESL